MRHIISSKVSSSAWLYGDAKFIGAEEVTKYLTANEAFMGLIFKLPIFSYFENVVLVAISMSRGELYSRNLRLSYTCAAQAH